MDLRLDASCSGRRVSSDLQCSGVMPSMWIQRSSLCLGVIDTAQRMTHICACTCLGGLQPSKWKCPFFPESITEIPAEAMIGRARSRQKVR